MNINILSNDLRALRVVAATDDVREYLNCIFFRIHDGRGVAVATDGHRLLALKLTHCFEEPDCEALVPVRLVDDALRVAKKRTETITITSHDRTVELSGWGGALTGSLIDASFADYLKVIPTAASGQPAQFNGSYLQDFHAVARYLGSTKSGDYLLHQNGDGPALVSFDRDAIGVVMPIRPPAHILTREWLI